LKAVISSGKKASEIADEIKIFPQVLKNVKVKNENKTKYKEDGELQEKIAVMEKNMKGKGRVLIRPSGTEPLIRVMLEGEDEKHIEKLAEDLADMLTEKYGQEG